MKGDMMRMRVTPADGNPNMESSVKMDHWICTIFGDNGRRMTITYSKGLGLHGNVPTLEEVLDCLASDSCSIENTGSFEDLRSELGYGDDSIQALRTYRACQKQRDGLKRIMSPKQYDDLLYKTERL